ncbi:MAG: hypothetical protein ACKO38_12325, partial [Planctomycetota bacterium]
MRAQICRVCCRAELCVGAGVLARLAIPCGIAVLLLASLSDIAAAAETWRAGSARVKITPETPMWMAGYGGRDHVAEGTTSDLFAKALVLEDARGTRAAIITL